ncbi:hypothetical protein [Amycolatopsis dendrobii]|uniref:Uncharacterized protein n=1 Tax=Amycolatopsis dendrobii TaxID=2760662 RepID=A0A7W3VUN2_9PSEU|nr:hypothetical protein [Amycolatopsis dendrobii]MBB1153531.1 hypothetical protein [Amycolatopsis dendrobii]
MPDKNTAPERAASHDAEVARLTARADLVIEELDAVVTELSTMLKSAYGIKDD